MKTVTIDVNEEDLDLIEDLFSVEQTKEEQQASIAAVKKIWQSIVDKIK